VVVAKGQFDGADDLGSVNKSRTAISPSRRISPGGRCLEKGARPWDAEGRVYSRIHRPMPLASRE